MEGPSYSIVENILLWFERIDKNVSPPQPGPKVWQLVG